MFAGMSHEQFLVQLQAAEAERVKMAAEMTQMKQIMDQMNAQQQQQQQQQLQQQQGATGKGGDWHQGQGAWEQGGKGGKGRVVLDDKYSRTVGVIILMEHLQSLNPGCLTWLQQWGL